MSKTPEAHERWRYKPNRGSGTFRVVEIRGDRVKLIAVFGSKTKTISLRTLRGDYEPVVAQQTGDPS